MRRLMMATALLLAFLAACSSSLVEPPAPTRAPTATPTPAAPSPVRGQVVIDEVFNSGQVEYVQIANQSDGALHLGGCGVYGSKDDASRIDDYTFPYGFILEAGETVRLHSGEGGKDSPPADIYWTEKNVWNNGGETAYLSDPSGAVIAEFEY